MGGRRLGIVAASIGILLHFCTSAVVISENGLVPEEQLLDKVRTDPTLPKDYSSKTTQTESNIPNFNTSPLSRSSEESSSQEDSESGSSERKNSNKNNFQDDSSSEENSSGKHNRKENLNLDFSELKVKHFVKRSLNSNEGSLNAIGKTQNENYKDNNEQESTVTVSTETTHSIIESTVATTIENDDANPEDKFTETPSSTEALTDKQTEATATETEQTESTSKDELTTETTEETEKSTTAETESSTAVNSKTTEADQETTTEANKAITEAEEETEGDKETTTEAEEETAATTTEVTKETTTEEDTQTENVSEVKSTSTSTSTTESAENANSKEETEENSSPGNSTSTEEESPKPEEKKELTFTDVAMARVNKLSDQIRLVLFEFRKTNVVVIPGQTIFPDPMPLQDFQQSFSIGKMDFKNMKIYGLSDFTVEHINTDVDKMQVYCLLHMKRLIILGNYTLRTFWSRSAGPFNVTLLNVDSEGVAEVVSAPEGHLEASDSVMDMVTNEIKMDFKNMGFLGSVTSSVGEALFNTIKPQILKKVNIVIRNDVNKKLKEFSVKFINKVAPVDLAISEGRKYVRKNGYDPYHIKDHSFLLGGLVYVNITDFWVEGLARFHRVGNLSLSMDKGVIEIGVHVATQQLTGKCVWSGQTFGIYKYGETNFTVHHLQVRALVTQSLDVRKKPQLAKLDLELGSVKVRMDSGMTLSYMLEGIINAFPRLIRHIIVDALEEPLRVKVQELLDKINVESVVDENLPRLDSFGL